MKIRVLLRNERIVCTSSGFDKFFYLKYKQLSKNLTRPKGRLKN